MPKIVQIGMGGSDVAAPPTSLTTNLDPALLFEDGTTGDDFIEIDTTTGSEKIILAGSGANVGVADSAPSATLSVKGQLDVALSNPGTSANHVSTPRVINCTAHGLQVGYAVGLLSGASGTLERFTVATRNSANQFTVDSDPSNATDGDTVYKDGEVNTVLNGDGRKLLRADHTNTILHTDGTLSDDTAAQSTLLCTEMSDSNPGDLCVLIGARAGKGSTATGITVVGTMSCEGGTSTETTALGYYSGNAGPGNKNTLIGSRAGSGLNSNAQSNVLVGHKAGETIDGGSGTNEGDFNVCIGQEADGTQLGKNQIAIGYQTTCDANSQARIGDGSNYAELSFSSTPSSWSFGSDERIKENVTDTDIGLDFINALRPIKHTAKNPADWPDEIKPRCFTTRTSRGPDGDEVVEPNPRPADSDEIIDGLLAQEVKAVCDAQGVSFSGWTEGANGLQRLQYERFVLPLIKAVQELSARVEQLEGGE